MIARIESKVASIPQPASRVGGAGGAPEPRFDDKPIGERVREERLAGGPRMAADRANVAVKTRLPGTAEAWREAQIDWERVHGHKPHEPKKGSKSNVNDPTLSGFAI